ncbi:hypothetical protein FRC01_010558 [Tulasnella sp. 417]|nr:hypothetical protein FRC01_010558 [Tulasnella sp. 417]
MAVHGGPTATTEPRASTTSIHRHGTLSKRPAKPPTAPPRQQPIDHDSGAEDKARKRSSSSLFGGFAGLFSHRSRSSAASGSKGDPPSPTKTRPRAAERDASPPRHRPQASGSGWQTRTDRNLRESKQEMVVGAGRAAAESSSEDEAAKKKGFFAIKKNDKSGKGKVREVEGPAPGGLAGGFLMRKKTTGGEPPRRRSRTVDEGTATHRLSRHSSDGELHRANSLTKRREVSPRRSRDDADLRRSGSVPPTPQAATSQPSPTTNPAPTPAPKDSPQQPKGGKIRKKAPAKHFDDGLGSAGGSLLKGAAAATAAASHAPSSPNAATGNTSLGGMGLPSSGGLSRNSTVRSANASVAGGRTTSLGRGPAPVNTQTQRRSSLQHDGLMAGGSSIPRGMTASPMQESSLSRSDSVGSRASGAGLPASRGRVTGNNLMSIIESPLPSRVQSRDMGATLEVVKAPPSLTSPTVPTLYLPRASAPSPPPPPVPSKGVDRRVSMDGGAPSGPKFVLPSELPKPKPGITGIANGSSTPPFSASLPNIHAPIAGPSSNGGFVSRNSSIRSNGIPSALAPPPLRSALRNRSPSPFAQPGSAPLPQSQPPPVPAKEPVHPILAKLDPPKPKSDDDDSASMSSYETGHEDFEESDAPTVQGEKAIAQPTPQVASGLFPSVAPAPPPHDPEKTGGTDLSHSTQTDSTGQPSRRKSVRMALPPSVSSTPATTPAARDEESHWGVPSSSRAVPSGNRHRRWHSHAERDIWAEQDSDAEGDYGTARKLLERATRHLETAGDLVHQKDKSSYR